ncbi:hypothetical protein PR202_gb21533 [Eleusine coracana subsp. coracana]|uniref:DUF6598 domain-containing protein n=1 Tax=Eleusine coracana subsp. coracana TaxID=191504 RepID=A0AAV5FDE8_ELECO|nr:hypothetical protein PR202_gb21533 [Eleusine coracana subsp. coracana]
MGSSRQSSEIESEASKAGFVRPVDDDDDVLEDEKLGWNDEDPEATRYRDFWSALLHCVGLGKFEDTTTIPAVRFTDDPCPLREAQLCTTLQNPYLVLSGPSRAIVLLDPVFFEILLKVKGAVESEDKILNFDTDKMECWDSLRSRMVYGTYTYKLSTMELTLGTIDSSVEASIFVRVLDGPLPGAFSVTASTNPKENPPGLAETDHKYILLQKSMLVSSVGDIKLSRSAVSVPITGELVVSLIAHKLSDGSMEFKDVYFEVRKDKKYNEKVKVGLYTMEISVAWSLISFISD